MMRIDAQARTARAGLDRLLHYVARNRRGQLLAALALGAVVGGGFVAVVDGGPEHGSGTMFTQEHPGFGPGMGDGH